MFPAEETRFRLWVVLVAGVVIVVGLAVWQSWPDPAKKQFPLAAEALTTVRTFRYQYAELAGLRPNRESHEIACPSSQHVTIYSASGDFGIYEQVYVDGRYFMLPPDADVWREYTEGDPSLDPGTLCQRLAAGQYTPPFPPYDMFLRRGLPEQGPVKTLEGGRRCQEWKVNVPQMGIVDDSESFCLDLETHLPLVRMTATGRYVFSDYNAEIFIKVPRLP